jgi:hypothetical protein
LICIRVTYNDNIPLTVIIIAPPDQATEGNRIFKSYRAWMEATHYRTGEKALLTYNVSKMNELSNPADFNSAPTGNTCFVLTEIYESKAGVLDHMKQAHENWGDYPPTATRVMTVNNGEFFRRASWTNSHLGAIANTSRIWNCT